MEKETDKPQRGGSCARTAQRAFTSGKDCMEKLERYFEEYLPASGEVADIEGLADYLGITRNDLINLAEHKTYGVLLRRAWNRIAKIKKQLAFRGKLPAAVLSFDLKNNHGYRDRPEEQQEDTGTAVIFVGKAEEWAK